MADKEIRTFQMQQGVFCKGRFYPFTKYTPLIFIYQK